MTDPRDRYDRVRNYTVSENQPYGMRIPEFVFRQLINFAIGQIRTNLDTPQDLISELFAMTGPVIIKQIKDWIREHPNIFVGVSWPREDISLPLVACINQGEEEMSDQAFLADQTGLQVFGTRGDVRESSREQRAIPMRHTTNVYVAAQDPELAMYLYNIVRFILVSNKTQLSEWYDVHNLVVSGQALEFDEKMYPTFGYYRVIQLQYMTLFDYNLSEVAARIVCLDLLVDTEEDGVRVVVDVPSPDS